MITAGALGIRVHEISLQCAPMTQSKTCAALDTAWRVSSSSTWPSSSKSLNAPNQPNLRSFHDEATRALKNEVCRVAVAARNPGSLVGVTTHTGTTMSPTKAGGTCQTLGPKHKHNESVWPTVEEGCEPATPPTW